MSGSKCWGKHEHQISDRPDIVVVVVFVVVIGFSTTMTTTAIADNDNDEIGLSEQNDDNRFTVLNMKTRRAYDESK
jgi:hypothetical protein